MKCILTCQDRPSRGAGDADPVDHSVKYEYCCEKAKILTTQGLAGEIHFCPGYMGGGPYMGRLKGNCYCGDRTIPLVCPYCGAEITQITLCRKIDGTLTGYIDHRTGKWHDNWPVKVVIRTYE
jgi:hypothetical protein